MSAKKRKALAIRENFRRGVKIECAKFIWAMVKDRILNRLFPGGAPLKPNKAEIVDEIGHSSSDFSRFEKGGLGDDKMFAALTELRIDSVKLPSLEARWIGGYRYAVYCEEHGRPKHGKIPSPGDMVSDAEFRAVRTLSGLFSSSNVDVQELTNDDWNGLNRERFGSVFGSGENLRHTYGRLHGILQRIDKSIPYKWEQDHVA